MDRNAADYDRYHAGPDIDDSELADKLETIATMLETARAIVAELECGETVEVETDADAAITNSLDLVRKLIADAKEE